MFWGLIMEPKRRYTQTVQKAFHISKAALDIYNCDEEPTQLILTFNSRNYLLCTLQKEKLLQSSLNLNFKAGDVICFLTNGNCNVHLSGYLVEDEFEEDDELSEDETIPTFLGKKRKTGPAIQQPQKKSKTELLLDEADDYDSEDDASFNLQDVEDDDDEANEVDDKSEDEEESDEETVVKEAKLPLKTSEKNKKNKQNLKPAIPNNTHKKKDRHESQREKVNYMSTKYGIWSKRSTPCNSTKLNVNI